jgi:predicted nucleic acid-binding protein
MLVLDANILIRAILGARVLSLIRKYSDQAEFFAPGAAFQDARLHLPAIMQRRRMPVAPASAILGALSDVVQTVELETYAPFEAMARQRLARRDEDDWPVLASALALNCPIWTEDADFFGCGVATWTTDRVELFLAECARCECFLVSGFASRLPSGKYPTVLPWLRHNRHNPTGSAPPSDVVLIVGQ